jgi:hypothetical protein
MPKFRVNHLGHEYATEQLSKEGDFADEYQIARRPRIRDDERHVASKAEPAEIQPLTVQIRQSVRLKHVVFLEETIQLCPGFEAEQLA